MKLINKAKSVNWRDVFAESVQVDWTDIPNGQTEKYVDEDDNEKTRMLTDRKIALGFQTETGRGKGIQWVPEDDISSVMDRLNHYATNGVHREEAAEDWLSPAETIDKTISRVPRLDTNGNVIPGEYDIAFRTRLGKGSKSCRVPEEDFQDFVAMLTQVIDAVPEAVDVLKGQDESGE